jgi:hypothetical protein
MVRACPTPTFLNSMGNLRRGGKRPLPKLCDVLQSVVRAFADRFHFKPVPPKIRRCTNPFRVASLFPDTVPALRELQKRYRLVVISNIDDDLFAETQKHLNVEFDGVITAEQARSYKPSINNFQMALRTLVALSGSAAARRAEHLSRCEYRRGRWGSRRCG